MSKKAYNYAIFLLSKRDYSIFKMRQKLRLKKYETEEIDQTIDKLIEQNYLREEEYKRIRIKSLLIKGHANSYISRKLEQEQLLTTDEDINSIRLEQDLAQDKCLDYLVQKKLRGKDIPEDFESKMKLKSKVMNFLATKGYTYEEAKEAISQYIS